MRVTNAVLQQESLQGIQKNLQAMQDANRKVYSGKQVERPSDDPLGVSGVLTSSTTIRALDQYSRNISSARSRLGVEESILEQLTSSLERAKELAVSMGSDTASGNERRITQREVINLREFAISLANTQFAGSYLFGGDYSDRAPFPGGVPDPAAPPVGDHQVEIGSGQILRTNHSGQEVFVDTGVFEALQNLSDAMGADDRDAILASITELDTVYTNLQQVVGDVGARMNQMDVAQANVEALDLNLRTYRSDIQDAELEEAITELVNRQTAYQAALAANARILQNSLTDYLR